MAKKRTNRNLIIGLVALIAVLLGLLIWRNARKPKGEEVEVEQVARRTIVETVKTSGKIFPQTEVKISSDVSGEIVELPVEEGDSVVMGQLLAKIDPEAIESQVARGQANVRSAKAQLANARSQIENFIAQKQQIEAQLINAREVHRRNTELREQGVISQADFETSLSNLQALEANLKAAEANIKASKESARSAEYQVESAQASLDELQTNLVRTTIYAPTSGIISQLSVEQGERVVGTIQMTGTEMMRIANLNAMEVRVEVSENDIPRVSINDEVAVEVDAYVDRVFRGRVYQIASSAITSTTAQSTLTSDQVTNFEVRISIDPESYRDLVSPTNPYPLRPGMSATVEIETETLENALAVPIQAVTTREEKNEGAENKAQPVDLDEQIKEVVFVVQEDTVDMVEVRSGIQDDRYIEIQSGLEEGQTVVTGPYNTIARKLEEGDAVEIKQEGEDRKGGRWRK
jgi:HlyD family secretion protein